MTLCLFVTNAILLGRVAVFRSDRAARVRVLIAIGVLQSAAVVLFSSPAVGQYATLSAVAFATLLACGVERSEPWREPCRLIALVLLVATCGLAFHPDGGRAYPVIVAPAHAWLSTAPAFAGAFTRTDWFRFQLYLCATLLCLAEANTATRLAMRLLSVRPPTTALALRDFQHGSLIGSLERVLVLIFVVHGAFNAVGFILTAKGLVRLRQLEAHDAGEYILIGTLISTGIAIAVGLWTVEFL